MVIAHVMVMVMVVVMVMVMIMTYVGLRVSESLSQMVAGCSS